MVRTRKLIAASPDPALHLLNQGFRAVAPSGAVQSEVFGFVVVTALHREGILKRRKEGVTVYYSIGDEATLGICQSVCARVVEEMKT
jgi:hypothetical protein